MSLLTFILLSLLSHSEDVQKFSPQFVIDQVIQMGLEKDRIQFKAQKSDQLTHQAQAPFDTGMHIYSGYDINQTESLSAMSNTEDKSFIAGVALAKKFTTGTQFITRYERVHQNSILSGFNSSLRPDQLVYNKTSLEVRQSLWNNAFGTIDRNKLKQAQLDVESAYLSSEEELEDLVLNSLQAYWDAYVAREKLNESMEARKLIEDLVKLVRRKSRLGSSAPGELPRIEAEFEEQNQRVKMASAQYLNKLHYLFYIMNIAPVENVEFESNSHPLPPPPDYSTYAVETNRNELISKKSLKSVSLDLENSRSSSFPELEFEFKWESSGLDENPGRSFSEMTSTTKPHYFAGLHFKFHLDSSLSASSIAHHSIRRDDLITYKKMVSNKLNLEILSAFRQLQSLFQIAKSNTKTIELRKKALQQMQKAYQQGRIELNTLIQAYRELFLDKVKLVETTGNYRITLSRYAALRDELILPTKVNYNKKIK